jgi:L-iditol 2-dehydrogenase
VKRGHPKIPFPTVLGHEFCGRISAAGSGTSFASGERVTSAVTGPCGECHECRNGKSNLCSAAFDQRVWGTWAEYVRVPARIVRSGLLRVPDGLSPAAAALLDPVASVLRGLGRLPDPTGKTALILGAGPIALLFTALLIRRGAGRASSRAGAWGAGRARGLGAEPSRPASLSSRLRVLTGRGLTRCRDDGRFGR